MSSCVQSALLFCLTENHNNTFKNLSALDFIREKKGHWDKCMTSING